MILDPVPQLTAAEALIRLSLAFGAGFIIGFERETHGRPAGFRTTILTCVAAALAMVLSEFLFSHAIDETVTWRPDPARLAAGILTGMGFLGGAGIIRQENAVRGVTTAAVLWYVTVLGLAFGSGFLRLGLIGLGIALVTLYILPRIESKIENDFYALLTVRLRMDGPGVDELRSAITRLGVSVKRQEIDVDLTLRERTVRFELKFKKPAGFDLSRKVIDYCTQQAGVLQAKWI